MKQKTEPKSKLLSRPQEIAWHIEKPLSTDLIQEERSNLFSASLVEFLGRMLIEKMFFHHLHIPQDLLLSLVNNVIQTVSPKQKTKIDVYQEGVILYKQFWGIPLTKEEERYDKAIKEIDVPSEILNGLKYSALALIGSNLYSSVTSTIHQGLWSHVPAIVGYSSAMILGPKLIQTAVENVLAYSGLTQAQKQALTPWLNTIGRLALGLIPKVRANEHGVHYHYPSIGGHTQTVTSQASMTLSGNHITLERQGHISTAEGEVETHYEVQFKLHRIREITQEKIKLQVINQEGKKIPVEFQIKQGELGREITVKSTDKQLETQWESYFTSSFPQETVASSSANETEANTAQVTHVQMTEPALARSSTNLACQSALLFSTMASAIGQNTLPLVLGVLSCLPKISTADTPQELTEQLNHGEDTSFQKRAIQQQAFPAVFDLNTLNGSNGFTIPGVTANDLLRCPVSTAGDINGDNITDLVLGIGNARSDNGTAYIIFGSRGKFNPTFDLSTLNGTNGFTVPGIILNGTLGIIVSTAGDINGDNISDVVLAAQANLLNRTAYVIFGRREGFNSTFNLNILDGTNGLMIQGIALAAGGGIDSAVSTAGDINGDNITDLILGAPDNNAAYVIFGHRRGFNATFNLNALDGTNGFTVLGGAGSGLGTSVSTAGDINGDNITDLVLGAPYANSKGVAYVIFGRRGGFNATFNLNTLNGSNGFTIPGIASGGQLGTSVSTAGDINGDNITDLVLGAFRANLDNGTTYVIFGKREGFNTTVNLNNLNGTNGFTIPGAVASGWLGISVSTVGDINGDNISDLGLGANRVNSLNGVMYVIFGRREGFNSTFNLNNLDGTNGFTVPGAAYSQLGISASTAGDINGDNITDLAMGAYGAYPDGAVYVIFGQNTAIISTPTPTPRSSFLTSCESTPLFIINNKIQIYKNQNLRLTPNDLLVRCGNSSTPNFGTLFNVTGINHAYFQTRNSSGFWNNASSFLGKDIAQGNVALLHDNSTFAPELNISVTDGQTTLASPVIINFTTSQSIPQIESIGFDINANGTTVLTAGQFQIIDAGTPLANVVISVDSIQGGYFTTVDDATKPIMDFTYYQLQAGQIQFIHQGTQLPNITLSVGEGSGQKVSPVVSFFSLNEGNSPLIPLAAIVSGAVGAVVGTTAIGLGAFGIFKYRQNQERKEERANVTPALNVVANPLQARHSVN